MKKDKKDVHFVQFLLKRQILDAPVVVLFLEPDQEKTKIVNATEFFLNIVKHSLNIKNKDNN